MRSSFSTSSATAIEFLMRSQQRLPPWRRTSLLRSARASMDGVTSSSARAASSRRLRPSRRWRQRRLSCRPGMSSLFDRAARTVRPKDVEFCLLSNGRALAIYLFFDGYRESERAIWGQIGYLFLDQALGEHDVETKVGPIQFFPSSAHPEAARYPFPELPAIFDAHFAELPRRQ